ncbi:MAG: type II toxin-antitoxin system VapC family toxin [Thermoleophilaceae bacterium]
MPGLVYLDASAIVKLVVEETESRALRTALRGRDRRISSALALVEVHLAAGRRVPPPPPDRVDTVLARFTLIPVDHPTLESAARLGRAGLRTLDAVHLATAHSLGGDLNALIAYDERLLTAARHAGLPVEEPR